MVVPFSENVSSHCCWGINNVGCAIWRHWIRVNFYIFVVNSKNVKVTYLSYEVVHCRKTISSR